MASPSFHNPSNSNYESLFVSPSPDPQLPPLDSFRSPQYHQQQQWERPSAPPRNPSFTLPRPVPSLHRQNSNQHPQPDPTLYQNHYFQRQSSGGQAGSSRQQGGQTNYQQQNQQAYQPYQQPQRSYYDLNQQIEPQLEPQLPSPSAARATNGNLTPERFELENGENYLTSTPEGGWLDAFLDPDYSDGVDLIGSNSNNAANNNQINNHIQEPSLFHPTWNSGTDPFAPPDTPPILHIQRREEPREPPRYGSSGQQWLEDRQRELRNREEARERLRGQEDREEEVLDLTHTSPTMPPKGTKRSAPGAGGSPNGTRATRAGGSPSNNTISPPPAKRTKTSTSTTKPSASIDDLFGSPVKGDEVDLVGVNDDEDYEKAAKKRKEEEAAKKRKEEQEKPVKLAQQQCVICLDQPDGLTVTHCGHMFCAECLHGALSSNMMGKKVCPVCRSTINTNKNKKGEMARSGVFHMEMKLQTRKAGKMAMR